MGGTSFTWLLPIGGHRHAFALESDGQPLCFCGVKAADYLREMENPKGQDVLLGRFVIETQIGADGAVGRGYFSFYPAKLEPRMRKESL